MGFFSDLFKKQTPQEVYTTTMEKLIPQFTGLFKKWIDLLEESGEVHRLSDFLIDEYTLSFLWGVVCKTYDILHRTDDPNDLYEMLRQAMIFAADKSGAYPKHISDIRNFGLDRSGYFHRINNILLPQEDDAALWYFDEGRHYSDWGKSRAVNNLAELFVERLEWERKRR